jgi:aldehyde dehydrogenase (NAD+)
MLTMSSAVSNPSVLETEIDRILEAQRTRHTQVALSSVAERRAKIFRIEKALLGARDEIREALWSDFRKPPEEVDLTEIFPVVSEARFVASHLRRWMKPRRVPMALTMLGSRGWIHYEPRGVVLIIAPWNYPLMLCLGPLISAIAAGNCAVLKPSEHAPATSSLMKDILGSLFTPDEVAVVEGAADVAEALLRRKWDHIFFTGSTAVGQVVMEAAARHLTSVTLELGGKSPVIVDRSADLDLAARRVAWGRCLNGGQSCVAPDYVLIEESVEREFSDRLVASLETLFPETIDPSSPLASIVNVRHFDRILALVDDARARGAEVVATGVPDKTSLRIPPTVVRSVDPSSAILREEIFGPVIPIVKWKSRAEAIDFVNGRDKPLALYVMTRDMAWRDEVLARTSAGTTGVNDTMNQFLHHYLPFGGVGGSGLGKAHGRAGFELFSNARSVLQQRRWNAIDLLYPPYTPIKRKIADLLLRWF